MHIPSVHTPTRTPSAGIAAGISSGSVYVLTQVWFGSGRSDVGYILQLARHGRLARGETDAEAKAR